MKIYITKNFPKNNFPIQKILIPDHSQLIKYSWGQQNLNCKNKQIFWQIIGKPIDYTSLIKQQIFPIHSKKSKKNKQNKKKICFSQRIQTYSGDYFVNIELMASQRFMRRHKTGKISLWLNICFQKNCPTITKQIFQEFFFFFWRI